MLTILEWFLADHVTLDWSYDAENTVLISGINYIWQYIQIENSSFKL